MASYILRRLASAIPLLLGIVIVLFLLVELTPGDPIQALVGDFPVTPEYRAQLEEQFGLDRPTHERLFTYLSNVVRGDLGFSFSSRRPVSQIIFERLPNTLLLTVTALVFASVIGAGVGLLAASSKRKWVDTTVTAGAIAGFSIPAFWLGQLLIILFALRLGWFPVQGMSSLRESYEGVRATLDVAWHLALPVAALCLREIGQVARIARASMAEALTRDHIWTARAKGLSRAAVARRHALRNGMLPVITVIGYSFGFVVGGSVLIETVFGWPGMGRLIYEAVQFRDNQVIIGAFLITAIGVVLSNLLTDLAYGLLDPRIRTGAKARK